MILIPILIGLYLIGFVGELKLMNRIKATQTFTVSSGWIWVLSILWPLTIYVTLLKEALA